MDYSKAGAISITARCWNFLRETKCTITQWLTLTAMAISLIVFLQPSMDRTTKGFYCCRSESILVDECVHHSGSVAVLRISFAFVACLLLSFLIDWLWKTPEPRSCQKPILTILSAVFVFIAACAATYIPIGVFDKAWTVALMFGAATFIVIQVHTVVRLSYVIIAQLHEPGRYGSNTARRCRVIMFMAGISFASLGNSLLIYFYPLCSENTVFLTTNIMVPMLACLWSVSDCVHARNVYSGFIQGSILMCCITYYTWSAFTSNPLPECNPYFGKIHCISSFYYIGVIFSLIIYVINMRFTYIIYVDEVDDSIASRDGDVLDVNSLTNKCSAGDGSTRDENVMKRVYYPLYCNMIRGPIVCFMVMSLLDWAPPHVYYSDLTKVYRHGMLFKLIATWFSVLFFIVTLYAPSVYGVSKKKVLLDKD